MKTHKKENHHQIRATYHWVERRSEGVDNLPLSHDMGANVTGASLEALVCVEASDEEDK